MNQQSINERLNFIVDTFENGRKASFARKVGISPQGAQEILAGRKGDPSFKVLLKILESYPQIRMEWLILGNGEALNKKPSYEEIKEGVVNEGRYWSNDDALYATPQEIEDAAAIQARSIPSNASISELNMLLMEAENDAIRFNMQMHRATDFYFRVKRKIEAMTSSQS